MDEMKMTPKENRKLRPIQKMLEGLDWFFELHNHQRHLILAEHDHDDQKEMAAEIVYDEKYQTVIVKIYPNFFTLSPDHQRKAILHELIHSITMPSRKIAIDFMRGVATTENEIANINEKMTSRFENLLHSLLLGRATYAREAYRDFDKKRKKRR